MSGAITASVAAVASVGMGIYNSVQANNNASTQLGMQQTVFNEQQGYNAQLEALLKNPSSVTSLPGYQFQFQQGQDALVAQQAAGGFLNSGNMAEALVGYGQGAAQSAYQQQVNILSGLSGMTAPTSAGQFGQTGNQAQEMAYNQQGGQLASLMYLGGMSRNGMAPWSSQTPTFYDQAAINSATQSMPGYLQGTPAMNPFAA